MNMDTNKKHTSLRAIILAACSLLLLGACDNYAYDDTEPDAPAKEVSLNFNASIERTKDAQSRAISTPITDFTGNTYSFGMSITKNENGNEIFKGSSDMTATMTRSAATEPWTWSFTDNSDASSVTPMGPEGKALKVVAYYPPVSSGTKEVYTNGIPFDFSSKTDLVQTDLLYNTDTAYTVVASSTEPVATIPLKFRHAYTWIVINITKYVDKGVDFNLSSVSLDNLGGGWIKNRGFIDPKTGLAKDGATAGPIGVTFPPKPLSKTEAQTYEFLVPSFMDTKVGNGDIVLVLKVNNINETFNLDKGYLNQSDDGTSFGFRQGYKNTYNLVYNNSALSMSIQDWSSEVINGDFGGDIPSSGVGSMKVNLKTNGYYWSSQATIPKPKLLTEGDHKYADYLTTVAYGGNGEYVSVNPSSSSSELQITDDINVYTNENAYPIIQITKNDVSIVPVPWEDGNGELVAKELCRKYNEGGLNDWRLPRATELRAVLIYVACNGSTFSDLNFNTDANREKPYWTGTEAGVDQAWSMSLKQETKIKDSKIVLSPLDKKMTASVRCVRDAK